MKKHISKMKGDENIVVFVFSYKNGSTVEAVTENLFEIDVLRSVLEQNKIKTRVCVQDSGGGRRVLF